ncbi:MAG: response regulator transcription factor [Hyphomonadaceae bacterium]|nr:response regulator transcription factor [Hyphomonadaceae bacterium]
MRILLVEDDAETARFVTQGLKQNGNHVEAADNGHDGLYRATTGNFDLIIVDRMLPGLDGLSLVRAARGTGVAAPVLFLTALGSVDDRVLGLESGGDDYLVKPFSFAELNARVNALARRPPLRDEQPVLSVADLQLDRLRRQVRRGEDAVELQPREFEILELLMLNAGRVVTRTMLLEQVWSFHFDPGTNIVETHISRIRGKIDRGGDRPLIHTVRGAGYVVRAD